MNKKLTFTLGIVALGLAATTLAACGEPKMYKITFESNGGTAVAPVEVEWNKTPTMPENPKRTGYSFANWYKDIELTAVYEPEPVKNDFTLYAGWSINQYTVTFNSKGGTPCDPIIGDYNSQITLPTTTRDYYMFGGWYTDEAYKSPFTNRIPSSNITVYAKWIANSVTYKFDKNSDDASGKMDNFTISQDKTPKKLDLCAYKREGYDFKGWALSPSATPEEILYTDGQVIDHVEVDETSTVTLYAVWEIKHININFYAADLSKPYSSTVYDYGSIIRTPGIAPTRAGYTYGGWGSMVKTNDTYFKGEKEYFKSTGADKYARVSVTQGASIPTGDVYYEVSILDFDNIQIFAERSLDYYALYTKERHTIEFINTVTGEPIETHEDYYNEPVSVPKISDIKQTGYTTVGWYKDEACTEALDAATVYIGETNVKYYAGFAPIPYDIYLNVNGGLQKTINDVPFNSKIYSKLSTPTLPSGYDFGGWFYDLECTKPVGENDLMTAGDLTLYAKLVPVNVDVKINYSSLAVGGASEVEIKTSNTIQALTGSTYLMEEKDAPTIKGFTYSKDASTSITVKGDGTSEFKAVYLRNVYTVSFVEVDQEGKYVKDLGTVDKEYESKITASDINAFSKDGYESVYYIEKSVVDVLNVEVEDEIQIEVCYNKLNVAIQFNGNGGTVEGNATKTYIGTQGEHLTAFPTSPVREGYDFVGWFTDKDDGTEITDPTQLVFAEEGYSIYAHWTINQYTLTFVDSDGVSILKTVTDDYGTLVEFPTRPTKIGYTFTGYEYEEDGDTKFIPLYKIEINIPSKDLTLKAKYEINQYALVFDSNGGTACPDSTGHEYGSSLKGCELPEDPTRIGYDFVGWFTEDGTYNPDGTPKDDWGINVDPENTGYVTEDIKFGADDITFYAQWAVHKHTIYYFSNESDMIAGKGQIEAGQELSVTPYEIVPDVLYGAEISATDAPAGTGTFLGWCDSDGYYSFNLMPDGNLYLYPKYDEQVYHIYFYGEDGQVIFDVMSDAENPTFEAYVKKILDRTDAYEFIYGAIQKAIEWNMLPPEQQEANKFLLNDLTAVVTYATVGGLDVNQLSYVALNALGIDDTTAYTVIANMATLPYSNNTATYYGLVYQTGLDMKAGDIVTILNDVNALQLYADNPEATQAEKAIYDAALLAIQQPVGDPTLFTGYANYCGAWLQCQSRFGFVTYFVNQQSGMDLPAAGALVTMFDNKMPYAENSVYYGFVATTLGTEQSLETIEQVATVTSTLLVTDGEEYQKYEDNAYNPYSEDANKAFDGWQIEIDGGSKEIKYTPKFVTKMEPVKQVVPSTVTGSSILFTWDKVADAYGYRVEVSIDGELSNVNIVNNKDFAGKDTIEYKVTGLSKGNVVEIKVYVLAKYENGEYRQSARTFTAKSLITGEDIATKNVLLLDSDPVSKEYIHTVESDIGNVSSSGDWYYLAEDDSGNKTYVLFANTTYSFGEKTIEIISEGTTASVTVTKATGGDKLVVGNKDGVINFTLTAPGGEPDTKVAIVRPLPSTISFGNDFAQIENTTVTSDTRGESFKTHDFLGAEDVAKEDIKVINVGTGSEVFFDINDLSTDGKQIEGFEREYTFFTEDNPETPISNPDSLYEINDDGSFSFKKTGKYIVKVTPKADNEKDSYVNTFVPNAYKNDASKQARLTKVFHIDINTGKNVHNDLELKAAYADPSVRAINILRNIKVQPDAASMVYYPYAFDTPNLYNDLLCDNSGAFKLEGGYIDIVDGTAEMTTSGAYGPKIWTRVPNGEKVFTDKEGDDYYYNKDAGTHAIKSAEWKQEFGKQDLSYTGKFIANLLDNSFGVNLKQYSGYLRFGTNYPGEPLVINGNYLNIDASDLPRINSAESVGAGSVLATYKVNSHQTTMFHSYADQPICYNNMTLIGNTGNISASLGESGDSLKLIAQTMTITSGGTNGIRCNSYAEAPNCSFITNGVNFTNILIPLYADGGATISYTHTVNTWANSIYSHNDFGRTVSVDHSVFESSGGALADIEDSIYTLDTLGYVTNPTVRFDYATCRLENMVSGEEQWFKAYSMESVALGLKSSLDAQIQAATGGTMTIIKKVTNPLTGLESECMNWVFFDRCQGAVPPEAPDATDLGTYLNLQGNKAGEYKYVQEYGMFVLMDENYQPIVDNGKLCAIKIEGLPAETPTGTPLPQINPDGNGNNVIFSAIQAVIDGQNVTPVSVNTYVFFRMEQAPFGWIEGMMEIYSK